MTDASTSGSLSERLERLTDDQRRGLAHALYVAQWFNTTSYSRLLEHAEVEALKLREYSRALYQSICRIAQLPAGSDERGLDLVLLGFELSPAGKYWGARGRLWDPERPPVEVHVLDQPGRSVALSIALVQVARSIVGEAAGEAFERFAEVLGLACDALEEALYPDPTLDQKIAAARERYERGLRGEGPRVAEDNGEPEPSFHGSGGVD